MRVVGLISGGKDSCYNMMQCVAEGHQIVALANLYPKGMDELDSYMYQTVGHQGIEFIAEAMELPLYRRETKGKSNQTEKHYVPQENDEVEDLFDLLTQVKTEVDFEAISVGAILSDYQRIRVENVCGRLGLISLAYLWRRDQKELLQEMIDSQLHAIIIKVASLGLMPNLHLGLGLREIQPHLLKMADKFGLNPCGEGGEYESFTLDCPLYKKRIVVVSTQRVVSNSDQVGYINFMEMELVDKPARMEPREESERVKSSLDYIADIFEEELTSDDDDDGGGDGRMLPQVDVTQEEVDYSVPMNVEVGEQLTPNAFAKGIENMESRDSIPMPQNKVNTVRSTMGWLWLGGIQGQGTDIAMAIEGALQELEDAVLENNYALRDLVSINLYVQNMDDYAVLNAVYAKRLNYPNPPIRVCVGVPLPKQCPVVMDALAFHYPRAKPSGSQSNLNVSSELIKPSREDEYERRKHTMHVQGISHWAPANIGPYSQSVRVGDIIYISGQISLIPGTMKVVSGGIVPQCKLSLRHMQRIAKAMSPHGDLRNVVQGTCFLTDVNNVEIARKEWEYCTTNAIIDYVIVKSLPRQSLVEWQMWLHTHNDTFEYEETGCNLENLTISIRRRWNYENNTSAIVCNVSSVKDWNLYYTFMRRSISESDAASNEYSGAMTEFEFDEDAFVRVLRYTFNKLLEGYPPKDGSHYGSIGSASDMSSSFGSNYRRQSSRANATPTVYLKVFYHVHLSRKFPEFSAFIVDTLNRFRTDLGELSDDSDMGGLRQAVQFSYTAVPVYGLVNKFTFLSINGIRHD